MKEFFIALLALMIIAGCKKEEQIQTMESSEQEQGRVCKCFIVKKDSVYKYIPVYGILEPYREVEYIAPVSGKIKRLNTGIVDAGKLIIEIEPEGLREKLKALKMRLEVLKPYIEKGFYKPEYYEILAQIKQLEEKLKNANFRAPFKGFVASEHYTGENVREGEKLFTFYQIDTLKLEVPISWKMELDRHYQVKLFGDSVIGEGFIKGFKYDKSSRSVYVIIGVLNRKGNFKISDFVKAGIVIKKGYGLKLPNSSIRWYKGKAVVFKLRGNRTLWKYVKPVFTGPEYSLVKEGRIKEGDTLILRDVEVLSHNAFCKEIKCLDTY